MAALAVSRVRHGPALEPLLDFLSRVRHRRNHDLATAAGMTAHLGDVIADQDAGTHDVQRRHDLPAGAEVLQQLTATEHLDDRIRLVERRRRAEPAYGERLRKRGDGGGEIGWTDGTDRGWCPGSDQERRLGRLAP